MTNKLCLLCCLGMVTPLAAQVPAPVRPQAYRVEFVLSRSQPGRTAESHTYTVLLQADNGGASVNVGRHIPITDGPEKFDYQFVGTSLSCSFSDNRAVPANELSLRVNVGVSAVSSESAVPAIQSVEAHVSTLVALGRRVSIAQFQDQDGSSSYDLQVLVSPIAAGAASASGS